MKIYLHAISYSLIFSQSMSSSSPARSVSQGRGGGIRNIHSLIMYLSKYLLVVAVSSMFFLLQSNARPTVDFNA